MKTQANKISMKNTRGETEVTIKEGRQIRTYSFSDYNAARSFVRRNYTQVGICR
jgi:hypothetical protein